MIHTREVNYGLEPDLFEWMDLYTSGFYLVSDPAVTDKLQPFIGNINRFNWQNRTVFQYQLDWKFDLVPMSASALVRYGFREYHALTL